MKHFGNLKSGNFESMGLGGHDAILVEGESLDWLLLIQHEINRLQVMGDDELRYFWIEVPENKKKTSQWYEVCSSTYKNFHSVRIINGRGYYCEIVSEDRGCLQNGYVFDALIMSEL